MQPPTATAAPLVEVADLTKTYPGVRALRGVTWSVLPGEIHALVGPNGAGKSTLMGILSGTERPDAGTVSIAGARVHTFDPIAASHLGVAIVPQKPDLFPSLSVLDNLFVGAWPRRAGLLDWRDMASRAHAAFDRLGVDVSPTAPLSSLSVAEQQMVQIARALLHDARVFIFDEPTAPLSATEVDRLFRIVGDLRSAGHAVVYITHRLPELAGLADRVTVMRDGGIVATLPAADAPEERIVSLMTGAVIDAPGHAAADVGAVLLRAKGIAVPGAVNDCSLSLARGEIVGLTGLSGSGAGDLAMALAGATPAAGSLTLDDKPAPLGSVQASQRHGIFLVPGDRHRQALLPGGSVRENVTVTALRHLVNPLGLVDVTRERAEAERLVAELDVRTASLDQLIDTLSGGNQQKVIVGRALATKPRVLILIEPTQGVDVAARAEIHRLLRALADDGVGILVAGTDTVELLKLCDRLVVMHRGHIAADLPRADADEQAILRFSSGVGETATHPSGAPLAATPTRRRAFTLPRELILAAFLAALAIAVGCINHEFATASNLTDVASNAAFCLVAAAAMTAVIIAGNVDISIGSILGLSAAIAGTLAVRGWPLAPLLAVTIAAGALFGAFNAAGVVGLRLPAIIVTLGTLNVFRGGLLVATGGRWISGLPPSFRVLALGKVFGVPAGVLISLACAVLIWLALRFTPWGRGVYLVGDNSRAASRLGVPVSRITASVLMLMGAATALAACMFAARFSAVQSNAGLGFEMLVITCVVVGGTNIFGGSGTILGTILGVLLVAVIGNALTLLHLSEYWDKAAQGSLVLAAVAADVLRRGRAVT